MPSTFAEPSLAELIDAFADGIRSRNDRYVDAREGAIYQHWGGTAAILWSRNARRDTDLWRAIYLDSAEAKDLTNLLDDRYGFERIPDAYGTGTTKLRRLTTAAGAGTVWKGTRIAVVGTEIEAKRYVVLSDTPAGATANEVVVPIRAERVGIGTAIDLAGAGIARVDDPLWDPTWGVVSITCADGTAFEPATAARARFRDARSAARAGFAEAIIQACKDAGASNAVIFPSDYAGDAEDHGLNMAYVGDASFQGDDLLVRRVTIALEDWRVLGDQLQVRPMVRTNLAIEARVHLWDGPTRVNQADVIRRSVGAILGYFGGSSGFSFEREALSGAMLSASPETQFIEFDAPTTDADVVSIIDGRLNFPAFLSRYRVAPEDITLTLLPPV